MPFAGPAARVHFALLLCGGVCACANVFTGLMHLWKKINVRAKQLQKNNNLKASGTMSAHLGQTASGARVVWAFI